MQDLIFSGDGWTCDVRAAGVLVRNGRILLQREKDGHEYAIPGGHIKIGETLADGLIREWMEETGAEIRCPRMLWTEECFWEWKGKKMHNLSFYFLIEVPNPAAVPDDGVLHTHRDNSRILLEWVPVEKVAELTVYPAFLKTEIHRLQEPVQHFVTYA